MNTGYMQILSAGEANMKMYFNLHIDANIYNTNKTSYGFKHRPVTYMKMFSIFLIQVMKYPSYTNNTGWRCLTIRHQWECLDVIDKEQLEAW
jgi:hypothetical protein